MAKKCFKCDSKNTIDLFNEFKKCKDCGHEVHGCPNCGWGGVDYDENGVVTQCYNESCNYSIHQSKVKVKEKTEKEKLFDTLSTLERELEYAYKHLNDHYDGSAPHRGHVWNQTKDKLAEIRDINSGIERVKYRIENM